MAKLVFLPVSRPDRVRQSYLLYDGACGTGGMLTVGEDVLQQLAAERGKQVSTHVGDRLRRSTPRPYRDLQGRSPAEEGKAEGCRQHRRRAGAFHPLGTTLFPSREFDFMLSNPPYGRAGRPTCSQMGGKKEMRDPRFVIEHADDPEYSLVTRSSDGQMLFLANKLSKMKQETRLGSRIAEVHNGSSSSPSSAGQGESRHPPLDDRERLVSEAIVALPLNMSSTTPASRTYVCGASRTGSPSTGVGYEVQLIDATKWYFARSGRTWGRRTASSGRRTFERICQTFLDFEETEERQDLRQRGLRVLEGDGGEAVAAGGGSDRRSGSRRSSMPCVEAGRSGVGGRRIHDLADELGSGPSLRLRPEFLDATEASMRVRGDQDDGEAQETAPEQVEGEHFRTR